MLSRRRFVDHDHGAALAGALYGGGARADPSGVKRHFDRQHTAGSRRAYLYQLLAGSVWTSVFALPLIRQDTLIVAGTDESTPASWPGCCRMRPCICIPAGIWI
jgi:hypothetical protein